MPAAQLSPENLPLRDIHLPPEISWWPPAPGWWLLLTCAILLCLIIYGLRHHSIRCRLRRLALSQLDDLERQYRAQADDRELLQSLSRLIRQAALLHFPHSNCAGLVDESWLRFLDQRLDGAPFSQGVGQHLARGPYLSRPDELDAEALLALCRNWLRRLPPVPKPQRSQR